MRDRDEKWDDERAERIANGVMQIHVYPATMRAIKAICDGDWIVARVCAKRSAHWARRAEAIRQGREIVPAYGSVSS